VNSTPLHYRADGSGRPVVLLHPVGLDLGCFDPLVREMGPGDRILRMDLRGHGRSPIGSSPAALRDYAGDVYALLNQLQFGPAAVIGFSFGGMIAQVLALEWPDAVSALVVSACPATLTEHGRGIMRERAGLTARDGMRSVVDATMTRWFSKSFRERGGDRAFRDRLLADRLEGWTQAWRAMADLDTAPSLSSIRIPALCLAGEADVASPPAVVEAIARQIPGARFVVIPGAPHMLFVEQPRAVAAAITSFLDAA
jgi:3-oxoadipate enol-lactonase